MSDFENENWLLCAACRAARKEAREGSDRLPEWQRLLSCIFQGYKFVLGFDEEKGSRPFRLVGARLARHLNFPLTARVFAQRPARFGWAFQKFMPAIADELWHVLEQLESQLVEDNERAGCACRLSAESAMASR